MTIRLPMHPTYQTERTSYADSKTWSFSVSSLDTYFKVSSPNGVLLHEHGRPWQESLVVLPVRDLTWQVLALWRKRRWILFSFYSHRELEGTGVSTGPNPFFYTCGAHGDIKHRPKLCSKFCSRTEIMTCFLLLGTVFFLMLCHRLLP